MKRQQTYMTAAKRAALDAPQPVEGASPYDPNEELLTLPVVASFASQAQNKIMIHVTETGDGPKDLPKIRAWLESNGVIKHLSKELDGHHAAELAENVLAGNRAAIDDFRTLNALAAAVMWFMRPDERLVVFRAEVDPQARTQAPKASAVQSAVVADAAQEMALL